MSYPGPPGEDERPLAGPDPGMGLPESGTQHATSTEFALPLDRPADPPTDILPAATPSSYGTPAGDVEPVTSYGGGQAGGSAAGALDKVKAFADQRPGAFLGALVAAGWLVGRLFSSSDED
jgi:hypothetical protein